MASMPATENQVLQFENSMLRGAASSDSPIDIRERSSSRLAMVRTMNTTSLLP